MPIHLPLIYSGKVRDIYEADHGTLLMVTSDRISAFDVVMNETVMNKGRVLTAMSAFWFDELKDIGPCHLISTDLKDFPLGAQDPSIEGRSMLVHKAEMLPIECIVRGYLSGSAWKEYLTESTMHGQKLSAGLLESAQLPEPVFTPSTKAPDGQHDINISFAEAVEVLGASLAKRAQEISLAAYTRGASLALEQGIIIADTKFELGLVNGELVIADEMLTPDSSRFWPLDKWQPGLTPPSFDKQPLRDYLETLDWNKQVPPPSLPISVTKESSRRYQEAYERITSCSLSDWPGHCNMASNTQIL